jgi:cytochrome c553
MKRAFILVAALMMTGGLTLAYAVNVEKGKALFESPDLGGGTTGKSCSTCHEGGKNLGSDLFARKQITIMKMDKKSLEEVINICIERPLGGIAIDTQGQDMKDLIVYIQTLVGNQAGNKESAEKK